jgi:hypothetical protein
MDTGYPALISDQFFTQHEQQVQKTSCGLIPKETRIVSAPTKPTDVPLTPVNES